MTNTKIQSYKDLIVWQKSMDLVVKVYAMTAQYSKDELYGLISQTRRSAVSIPSNIAEWSRRVSKKDFRQFVLIAYGSGSEIETQIEIAKRLPFGQQMDFLMVDTLLDEVMKMLNALSSTLLTTH